MLSNSVMFFSKLLSVNDYRSNITSKCIKKKQEKPERVENKTATNLVSLFSPRRIFAMVGSSLVAISEARCLSCPREIATRILGWVAISQASHLRCAHVNYMLTMEAYNIHRGSTTDAADQDSGCTLLNQRGKKVWRRRMWFMIYTRICSILQLWSLPVKRRIQTNGLNYKTTLDMWPFKSIASRTCCKAIFLQ
jgi:hypothetical protein